MNVCGVGAAVSARGRPQQEDCREFLGVTLAPGAAAVLLGGSEQPSCDTEAKLAACTAHRRRSATHNCLSVELSHLEKGSSFEVLRTALLLFLPWDPLSPSVLKGRSHNSFPGLYQLHLCQSLCFQS